MPFKTHLALAASVAMALTTATAKAELHFWTDGAAGNSNFSDPNNWDFGSFSGFAPNQNDLAVHNSSSLPAIQVNSNWAVDSLRISNGGSVIHTAGTLTIDNTEGTNPFTGKDAGLWVGEFGPTQSNYQLAGGTIQINDTGSGAGFADGLQIGRGGAAQFDFTSGTINNTAGDTVLGLDGDVTFNHSAGSLNTLAVQVGWFQSPNATVNLSGTADWNLDGALLMSDGASGFANAISSNLNITGSNVTIDTNGIFLRDKANLNFVADASGVSPIIHNFGGFELQDIGGGGGLPGLTVDLSSYAPTNDEVTLIDGFSLSVGSFDGLAEGTLVPNSGNRRITYRGGDGFDVVLVPDATYMPPPPDPVPVDAVIARWSMTTNPSAPGPFAEGNPKTLDSRLAANEGVFQPSAAVTATNEDLFFFSADNGHTFTTSSDVPPTAMFANGNTAGTESYDASAVDALFAEGALFFPQNEYGDELSFDDSFSVEAFFKTGDTDIQQILLQGENFARYGLTVNEDAGGVRFFVNDGTTVETIDIGGSTGEGNANYADNQWHYLLATFEENAGANGTGQLTLSIANEDGSTSQVVRDLPNTFLGLPTGNDGNMFIGVEDFSLATDGDPRRFNGLLDEIQLTRGLVSAGDQLGILNLTPAVPGDFDGDGFVGLSDLNILGANFGTMGGATVATGDATGDGNVDLADLNVLGANWSPAPAVAVPEPSGMILGLLGLAILARGRK